MDKIVLPRTFTPDQVECAIEVAHSLGFKTEMVRKCNFKLVFIYLLIAEARMWCVYL